MNPVAVLCAQRDARTFAGGMPVVAHPPCRLWGRLRMQAKSPDADAERALGLWCAEVVRTCGGVLEHPGSSTLWNAANLPKPGVRDARGFTLAVSQSHFGHRAEKLTWLYLAGIAIGDLSPLPIVLSGSYMPVENMNVREREKTPADLARWLVAAARTASAARFDDPDAGARVSGVEMPPWRTAVECSGCGRRGFAETWEADIRAKNPGAITCCPDRDLIPVEKPWRGSLQRILRLDNEQTV